MKVLNLTLAAAISIGFATSAHAINTLQLSIANGTYNSTTQTTVAASSVFTLYAYLTPGNGANVDINALLDDTYYVSMAVAPKTGPTDFNLGSFNVGTSVIDVKDDMTYGTPPFEALADTDPGDLSSHGVFETFFYEHAFTFDSSVQTNPFDVQTSVGRTPTAGSGMYFVGFEIDVTQLEPEYAIHFDLYNSKVAECKNKNCVDGDIDVNDFAPFSHDAGSGGGDGDGGDETVPEPGSLFLIGGGLLGLWASRRRFNLV